MKTYYVYIMMNKMRTVLYVGVTNDLVKRTYEHKNKVYKGFTQRYNVNKLVYFEEYNDITQAIAREKQIKGWSRAKKLKLIESMNPYFKDLYEQIIQ
ncbi:MAG: GIY-YIG nuclease family protein [Candidatus Parcubacteria bacterium]|nr:GIY-YIG nuclease family protein [Candidatus Parcubacteria bacterium]